MKNDLLKVLNFKLKNVNDNIEELKTVDESIEKENDNLTYVKKVIEDFASKEGGFDIYKFANLSREDFNKLLMELDDSVLAKFGTNSCNYDGLIYLIQGINNGISLTLTQEQTDAINYLIDKLLEKEKDYADNIERLNIDKQKLPVKDMEELNTLQGEYSAVVEKFEEDKYVNEVDLIIDAINYNDLPRETAYEMLCYLLKYNADAYEKDKEAYEAKEKARIRREEKEEKKRKEEEEKAKELEEEKEKKEKEKKASKKDKEEEEEEDKEEKKEAKKEKKEKEDKEEKKEEEIDKEEIKEEVKEEKEEPVNEDETFAGVFTPIIPDIEEEEEDKHPAVSLEEEMPNLDFLKVDEETPEVTLPLETKNEEQVIVKDEDFNDLTDEDYEDYNPVLPEENPDINLEEPKEEQKVEDIKVEDNFTLPGLEDFTLPEENKEEVKEEPKEVPEEVNNINDLAITNEIIMPEGTEDLVLPETNEPETYNVPVSFEEPQEEVKVEEAPSAPVNETKLDVGAVTSLLAEYGIKYDKLDEVVKAQLLKGNLDKYREILEKLKSIDVLDHLSKNPEILVQIVLYSSSKIIDDVVNIIGNDLSVDEDDKVITTKIVFDTMPSVFMDSEGNYQNFMENVKCFKSYGIDLIHLFDFSKEIFVADNERITNNYMVVRDYDLTVNDRNAKYLLLLPNIAMKLDYYIESVYKDNMKGSNGETFDGTEFIKLYPGKLNVVCDETIKRLRYSSENGKKIFGSKEKSLAGEITNMKVDILNLDDAYRRNFFNNEFDTISRDEVSDYERLIMEDQHVNLNIDDYVNKLENLRSGLRYVIEGVNVSRNKVLRNYNILINNGVDKEKALLFAVCHNLVITHDEYNKVKNYIVNGLGGN